MKRCKYGYYGEDNAHRIFLDNYLAHFVDDLVFERDDAFCKKFRASGKKQVDTKFADVAERGLTWYNQQVFFVIRDVDSITPAEFSIRYSHFASKGIDKLLIALPVQCIEHWLWYLKQKRESPGSTKNVSLENQPRKRVKSVLYGHEDPPNSISNPIVDRLSKSFDVEWLESRSKSFKHFHQQVCKFIQTYNTPQP